MHKLTKILFRTTISWLILAATSKAGILGLYTGTGTNITNTYPLIVTGPGLTSNRPNYYIIMDTNYAATIGVNFLSSVSTNDIVTNYLWTFQNGTPASSTNACPGPVIFPTIGYGTDDVCQVALQHMVGTNVCTSITSQITNVVGGVTNTHTVTNWLYTINVQVPTFTFTNDQVTNNTNIFNYIKHNMNVINNKQQITTSVYIQMGAPSLSLSNFSSAQDPSAYFLPPNGLANSNGLFTNQFTSTNDSTLAQTNVTIQFIGPSASNMPIVSQSWKMVPAVYQDKFRCSVYYTIMESGVVHPGTPVNVPIYSDNHETNLVTNYTCPANFITGVNTEGYGRLLKPINGDNYIGLDSNRTQGVVYFLDTTARGNASIGGVKVPLHPTYNESQSMIHSAAADRDIIPYQNYIMVTTNTISSAFSTSEFYACDVGYSVTDYHVDLYYGDDAPISETVNGLGIPKDCTFPGDNANSFPNTMILVGTNQ